MSGSVSLGGQQVSTGVVTLTESTAAVSGTGINNYDGSTAPAVVAIDANNPTRKVSPAGAVTLLANPTVTNPLTATADNSVTFSQQVREVWIRNTTAVDVYVWPDAAASTAAWPVLAGEVQELGMLCTVLHVFPAAAGVSVNVAGGLYIKGGV